MRFNLNGEKMNKKILPLIIEDNVGIQMNVTIPRGVLVGANSLIGANTVIRKDVSRETLIYTDNILKEKYGISAGLQFI